MFLLIFLASKLEAQWYITWDDLRMRPNVFLDSTYLMSNKSDGIIVVDSNGHGDSLTVQGAVDMVPEFNFQRVKILIRRGIYRYVYIDSIKNY